MGILEDLENIKFRPVIDLIKKDEIYDKKRNSLTGLELFVLLHRRFLKLKDIISPLKEKLGKGIEITDIEFAGGMQDEINIVIEYQKKGKLQMISISNFFDEIEITASDKDIDTEIFRQNNKKIFQNIIKAVKEYDLFNQICIKTTSQKLFITDLADSLSLRDNESKLFTVNTKHSLYEKKRLMISNINCNYPKIKELLEKEDNVLNIYSHIHVYEEDLDKVLIKKLK